MTLVAQLREIESAGADGLNRYSPHRPTMIDGSLSELVSRALNISHSKKNFATGEPFYGEPNPTGDAPPGAGGITNIFRPDSPLGERLVRPTLEGMQMDSAETMAVAEIMADAIDANAKQRAEVTENPVMVYVIPEDGNVTEEMNSNIGSYADSGAVDLRDFVFVYTDATDSLMSDGVSPVNLNQRIGEYKDRGAKVYQSLESFFADYDNIRARY